MLAGHFKIEKTWELVAWQYYLEMFHHDVEEYVRVYNVYLALKVVKHKVYGDL